MTFLRSNLATPLVLSSLVMSLDSCAVVGGIFKAGVWVGVVSVFLVVALIIWVARAVSRPR
jgi:Ni,Fe-hydrogenase III small subunit